jgi:hypothetical protein
MRPDPDPSRDDRRPEVIVDFTSTDGLLFVLLIICCTGLIMAEQASATGTPASGIARTARRRIMAGCRGSSR